MGTFPHMETPRQKQQWLHGFKIAFIAVLFLFGTIFLFTRNADPALTESSFFTRVGSGGSRFFATFGTAFDRTFLHTPRFLAEVPLGKDNGGEEMTATTELVECTFDSLHTPKHTSVLINEVAWMGDGESPSHEWVELVNRSSKTADISNWHLLGKSGSISILFPRNTTLPAHGFLLLSRNQKTGTLSETDIEYSGSLRNENEGLRLVTDECASEDEILASTSWPAGNNATKQTMERDAVGFGWHTSNKAGGTPRYKNSTGAEIPKKTTATMSSEISILELSGKGEEKKSIARDIPLLFYPFITEICVGTETSTNDEFIELYNPNDVSFDLSGWYIRKQSGAGNESAFVSASRLEGKVIPPKKHFLIVHEGGYAGSALADAEWPKSYTLAYTANAIILYNEIGERVDMVAWESMLKNQSLARKENKEPFSIQEPNPENSGDM